MNQIEAEQELKKVKKELRTAYFQLFSMLVNTIFLLGVFAYWFITGLKQPIGHQEAFELWITALLFLVIHNQFRQEKPK